VERSVLVRADVAKVGLKHVSEDVVVAVPVPAVIQRDDEQVLAAQGLEHLAATARLRDRVAQVAGQPVEDGRPREEGAGVVGLAREDLVHQVVDEVPIRPLSLASQWLRPGKIVPARAKH
jgi:hypothetical protein